MMITILDEKKEEDAEKWILGSVYNTPEEKELEREMGETISETNNAVIIIGGDFNVRTGHLGGVSLMEGGKERSKDKKVGKEGKKLIEWLQNKGWCVERSNRR